jgi:hypothetical protein
MLGYGKGVQRIVRSEQGNTLPAETNFTRLEGVLAHPVQRLFGCRHAGLAQEFVDSFVCDRFCVDCAGR